MFKNRKEKQVLYETLAGVQDISTLPATSLNLYSSYNHGLDSGKENYTTFDIFIAHVFKILLTYIIFVYMRLFDIHELILHSVELLRILRLDIRYLIHDYVKILSSSYFQNLLTEVSFYWYVVTSIPGLFWKVFNPWSGTPIGLDKFLQHIPKTNTPSSLCLILHYHPPLLKLPPDIPQPYLDSDRKIQVPQKKDVQYAIAIRSEYFAQYQAHVASERVRLLREMGRFITWCCLVPSIESLTIVEKKAICWEEEADYIDSVKNAILVELVALSNTCEPEELAKLKSLLPQIVLVNKFSKAMYTINENEIQSREATHQEVTLDEIITSYQDQRKLTVVLCDSRVRTTNYKLVTSKPDDLKADDPEFNNQFPPTPEYIIAPRNTRGMNHSLEGYACIDEDPNMSNMAVVHFLHLKFGFAFFSRALYHYALEKHYAPPTKEEPLANSTFMN
ncbi:hypothetical protein CANMA_004779 [Candida margitis]|uniref:uncharacterized protein n=1 Tax=Candida margitis TaxID=1775924 RepID=UPI0022278BAF|nr:uncharacterized protein CANMA_004779 [Candida margitis]KAI5953940.1 hypothetical protein CANMA_004779 [Candida margitis]